MNTHQIFIDGKQKDFIGEHFQLRLANFLMNSFKIVYQAEKRRNSMGVMR